MAYAGTSSSSAYYSSSSSASSNGPITRSRTGLFLSYRDTVIRSTTATGVNSLGGTAYPPYSNSRKGKGRARYQDREGEDDDEEKSGLLAGEADDAGQRGRNGHAHGHSVVQMDSLPPKWVDEADKVDVLLEQLKPKLGQLDKLHSKHVLPSFSDKSAEEREIAALTASITRDLRKCQAVIAKIAHMAKNLPLSTTSKEDRVMIVNVQTALATKVQGVSTVFRKKQSNYLKQLRGYELRNQDVLAASGAIPIKDSYSSVYDDVELSQDTLATSSISLQAQAQETAPGGLSLEALTQRDREVTSIAESITDLAGLFKDLSALVIDQGTLLDRIDYNVEVMASEMEKAVGELNIATKYQRRSGKRQVICLLILLIIGAIIILVYKPRTHATAPAPDTSTASPALPSIERLRVLNAVARAPASGRRQAARFVFRNRAARGTRPAG